jgi:hypothetical protein
MKPTGESGGGSINRQDIRQFASGQERRPPCLVQCGIFAARNEIALRPVFLAGSAGPADLQIEDPTVSGLHFLICKHDAEDVGHSLKRLEWFLYDLDSENGTWLNGKRIEVPALLENGDYIQVGRTNFMVVLLTE